MDTRSEPVAALARRRRESVAVEAVLRPRRTYRGEGCV